ncbi:MAG: ergothioneine biosynthesis protein EgtB [Deltaproteobacteria bacterium]|nr:ergothioneine biosynthesis protein EgtB [Deltaproteobacteria bacterium]
MTAAPGSEGLAEAYGEIRRVTERLAAPLSAEDCVVQSMPDASPVKWHLAHTTWFFETFVVSAARPAARPFHPQFRVLFNSYYNAVGPQHPRPERGMLSRPALSEVRAYREHVDCRIAELFAEGAVDESLAARVELGLHHEQQHQELILTDLKHMLWSNPLRPAYRDGPQRAEGEAGRLRWRRHAGGAASIGHAGGSFSFDNERPRHRVMLEPFEIASRPVTTGEFLEFIEDGGYERAELWLSDGWDAARAQRWRAPLYWRREDGAWRIFTLSGARDLRRDEPVAHVSFYEADAFARWSQARLPSEAEWEVVAAKEPVAGNLLESGLLHPAPSPAPSSAPPAQLFGDVWEWTRSAYAAYPGFRAAAGALGEYNAKFMCNQLVLRGGSCVTPRSHLRATYRNFFPPQARWQFSGLRLARDP